MRVLKPGGVIHGCVPLEDDFRSLWRWFDFISLHDKAKLMDGQIQRFTKKSLKAVFARSGLELVSEYYSYQLIGNLLDFTLFNWLYFRRKLGHTESHYEVISASRSRKPGPIRALITAAESSMYWEGRILGPYAGMNAHLTYRMVR
jgi:hypothetical protein